MAQLESSMDYDGMQDIIQGFDRAADALGLVEKACTVAINAIRASIVGNLFLSHVKEWLRGIKQACNNLEEELRELSGDLQNSMKIHQAAQEEMMGRHTG